MTVNGKDLKALVDTGSDQTLVNRKFVAPSLINYPSAEFMGRRDWCPLQTYWGRRSNLPVRGIGVADNLLYPVAFGRDLPVLLDLVQPSQQCNVVVSRAMAKHPEEPIQILSTAIL